VQDGIAHAPRFGGRLPDPACAGRFAVLGERGLGRVSGLEILGALA
jgi:hypothetical protein